MKITYTCEICGNTSSDKEKISSCESLGNVHKFKLDSKVRFRYAPHGLNIEIEGIVSKIEFKKKTHKPAYWISIDPKTQKKVGFTYDSGNLVPVGTYSEEEMTLV